MSIRKTPKGMTVLELVVAVALLGLLVAIATSVLGGTTAAGRGVQRASMHDASSGIALSTLRSLLANARADDGRPVFDGDPLQARFVSACASPLNDVVRCEVTIRTGLADSRMLAWIQRWHSRGPAIQVRGSSLAYLSDQRERRWASEWDAIERVPTAIAVVAGSDTMFFSVGRP